MRLPWLADVLRDAGLDVYEVPGWQDRGDDLVRVDGLVWHHTASSPRTSDTAMAAILRDGRRDLAGPLSQLGLERDATFVVVAAGKANHNGYGEWGNQAVGIEAYNDGVGEPWSAAQIDAYERGSAAILRRLRFPVSRMKGHRETDPDRKIDPAGIDMDQARQRVDTLLSAPTTEGLVMDSEVAARFDALEGKLDRLIASARTETARDLEAVRGLRKLLVKFGLARG